MPLTGLIAILINFNYKEKCRTALNNVLNEREKSLRHTIDFEFPERTLSLEIREVAEYKFKIEHPTKVGMITDTPTVYSTVVWRKDLLQDEIRSICGDKYDASKVTLDIVGQHPECVVPINMDNYKL